jgi:phage baseplate assembly protein W
MEKQRFLGMQYPLVKTPRGILAQKNGINQIKADLLQLLLTNPGERVMLPSYGTPLRTLLFEPNDAILEIRAKQMIADAILIWEPRIVITNIEVKNQIERSSLNQNDTNDEIDGILFIKIKFVDPENITEIEELIIERPLGG